jgi:hypothetical protein
MKVAFECLEACRSNKGKSAWDTWARQLEKILYNSMH